MTLDSEFWTLLRVSPVLQDFAMEFLAIFLEGLPFIFLGTLVSGFLGTYLPQNAFERFLPKNPVAAVLLSGLLGLIFPVCECAVVPVIRRLVKNGLPASCAVAYMLAAPIINPVTILSTFKAFSVDPYAMTLGRTVIAYLVASGTALLILRLPYKKFLKKGLAEQPAHLHPRNLTSAMTNALHDLVDVGIYFVIGVTLTAFLKAGVIDPTQPFWRNLETQPAIATPAFMSLAFILSLCSSSDAFIAANLGRFGAAAKLGFLVFGPMMDAKLVFLYSTVFQKKFILWLAVGLFISIGILSLLAGQTDLFTTHPTQ